MSQILDGKFVSRHVVGKDGRYMKIPTVNSWRGIDESLMDKFYQKIKQAGEITYYDLMILGWVHKTERVDYKERQALLGLESLGKVFRKQTLEWSLDELWSIRT